MTDQATTPELRSHRRPLRQVDDPLSDGERRVAVTQASSLSRRAGFQPGHSCSAASIRRARVEQRRRNLPHFEQPGATYFVTFPPRPIRFRNRCSRNGARNEQDWLKHHPPPWDWKTEQEHRQPLRRASAKNGSITATAVVSCAIRASARVVADALASFSFERYRPRRFVVMPNHVHALVKPLGGAFAAPKFCIRGNPLLPMRSIARWSKMARSGWRRAMITSCAIGRS